MRLRSRAGVRGSCQTRGRSDVSPATRAFMSSVTGGVAVCEAFAYSSSARVTCWRA